jgi:DNA repair protein RecO (recombination protein O)
VPLYSVEAINIKTFDLGEADRIITLFSRERGKIRAVAKGARRIRSRFGGRLELLVQHRVMLAEGKNDLDQLQQTETIEPFFALKENMDTLSTACYFTWLVDRATEEKQRNEPLYDLLRNSLTLLLQGHQANVVRAMFQKKILEVEGILPQLGEYVSDALFRRQFGDYAALKTEDNWQSISGKLQVASGK